MKFTTCDQRLSKRATECFQQLQGRVHEPFPEVFSSSSGLAGFYRLINNKRVKEQDLLNSIRSQSFALANDDEGLTVCVHDTTQLNFRCLELSGKNKFFSHTSLAVSFSKKPIVYGLVGVENWQAQSNTPNEQRWSRAAILSNKSLSNTVHVMDREADSYRVFSDLDSHSCKWVIRLNHNRSIGEDKIFDLVKNQTVVAEREVILSKRSESLFPQGRKIHPARKQRKVKLGVQFIHIKLP